jgi:phosphatidylserine/phosphatidylglycerophosphate/cardiolipin synthase-like enzyme
VIRRLSSRRQKLDHSFLTPRLLGAKAYDRIAGYFSSSILEVAGEALETMSGPIRVICNSDLDARDVATAKAASYALRREWCASEPEKYNAPAKDRFARLYTLLRSGKMQVKVLPREKFGLVHGKAGVMTLADGHKTAFVGSANETYDAWKLHYELIWEDDSPEAVQWVQEEFDALWHSPFAVNLADFVIEDIGRLARRRVVPNIEVWREEPEPAAPIIETPVYRREYGLWEHQKAFVKLAFDAHRGPHGARLILADMVGLGKTLQLAMAGMLMALYGTRPLLVLAPKTLVWQWQDEMQHLLDMPSAVWTGK